MNWFLDKIKNIFKSSKSVGQRVRFDDFEKELNHRKEEIAKQIKIISSSLQVSAKELVNEGNHPTVKGVIERGEKNYTIDTLLKYLISIEKVSNRKNSGDGFYAIDLYVGVMNVGSRNVK